MRGMTRLPEAVFIVDPRREELAVKEARRLEIPIIAMVDTNSDPDVVDYVIPSNDDAIRSVRLLTKTMADAALEGRGQYYAATVAPGRAAPAGIPARRRGPGRRDRREGRCTGRAIVADRLIAENH